MRLILIFSITVALHVSSVYSQNIDTLKSTQIDSFTPAMFSGGNEALTKFIIKNLRYPKSAIIQKIEGLIYIEILIESDGRISRSTLLNQLNPELEKEAIRIIEKMPKWIPAIKNNQKIRSSIILPIRFTIPKSTDEQWVLEILNDTISKK
jgi:periplasmic protein TonB